MNQDDDARRSYWTAQFDDAYRFMFEDILPYPVDECGEKLVSLPDASKSTGTEVMFSALKHVRELDRLFYLREGQIDQFIGAAKEMNSRGWAVRVEDAFRTREIQKYLGRTPKVFDAVLKRVIWELGGKTPTPEFMFRRCTGLVATVPKFGTHMSGSAIDMSVVYRDDPGKEVDRGAPYIEMSALTPMYSPFVSPEAHNNRIEITKIMRNHGFIEYPYEFWHYSSGDAYDQFFRKTGKPAKYGAVDRDPLTNTVKPLSNPNEPLNSKDELRLEIEASLKRLGAENR
jgi:zinc D-Ala-D-Ala dipeptidase